MNRYARQISLPNFGLTAQDTLKKAKVLVVGAGGLGCPALQYLAAAGVGTIGVADGDFVDITNLHRQVLFSEADVNTSKAEAAILHLQNLNSETELKGYPNYVGKDNVFDIVESFDLVLDCTDRFGVRYLLDDVCGLLKKPMVFASVFQYEFQVSVFHFGENPRSLRDLFSEIPDEAAVPNCSEAGVLGSTVGMAGTMQALEAIKIITGIGKVLSGELMVYNTLNQTMDKIRIPANSGLYNAGSKDEILSKDYSFSCVRVQTISSKTQLTQVLSQTGAMLIDVRNATEMPRIDQFEILEIPLTALSLEWDSLRNFDTLVCICQSGGRSRKAAEMLQNKYPAKQVWNVNGGISIITT